MHNSLCPAVFVDRDGTLMEEVNYCREASEVRVFEGVREGLARLRARGFRVFLVTNQSGIARGIITPSEYESVHKRLLELLGPGALDGAYMCPDGPGTPSFRRKPEPGMLLEAAAEWNLSLEQSWIVGDKDVDIGCGRNAGVRGILVRTGHGAEHEARAQADKVVDDFRGAVEWILAMAPEGGRFAPGAQGGG